MNRAQLEGFRQIADQMIGRADWQWVGPHLSQRMFGITRERAEAYAARHGGTAQPMDRVDQVGRFNIRVTVSGGVTGYRESLLKSNAGVQVFETRDEAETAAADYVRTMNGPRATAQFSATVVPAVDEVAR